HHLAGADLVAHRFDRRGRRADEDQPLGLDGRREGGILRQEAVAGVNHRRPRRPRGIDQRGDVEIAVARPRRADADRGIRLLHVAGGQVGLRAGLDMRNGELAAGALDAGRDLAAIGDQQPMSHADTGRIRTRTCPAATASSSAASIVSTVPSTGVRTGSIDFIASISSTVSPAATRAPASTKRGAEGAGARETRPGIGAATSTRSSRAAAPGAVAETGAAATACSGAKRTCRSIPSVLMRTSVAAEPARLSTTDLMRAKSI